MGECAYAAVSDQLLNDRGRPGRLRGVGVSGAAVVFDPLRNRPCPRPACFASVCQLMLLSLSGSRCFRRSTVEVAGVRPSDIQAPYDPNRRGLLRPIRALKKCYERRFFYGAFPASFLSFRIRRHPSTIGDRNVGKSTVTPTAGRTGSWAATIGQLDTKSACAEI
jgi:hypothetical protein